VAKGKKSMICDIYNTINAPPISEPTRPAVSAFRASEVAAAMYPSPGPYIPPEPVCPGEGAAPPPPFIVEAAVGRFCDVVGVEEVALAVELAVELDDEFEEDIGSIVVNTDVAMTVLPAVTKVERDVAVMTESDCEGDDDDDDEFVEF
jgi:hypothetical protein